MLQRVGNEAPVQPRLVHVADVEPQGFGEAVVVDAERRSEMDREAIDVFARKPGVIERLLERGRRECELAVRQAAAERAAPDPHDRGVD